MKTNWQTKKLGEVCDIGAGNSAPQRKELFIEGKYPFFRTSDVGRIHLGKIEKPLNYLNDKGIKKLKLFKSGTLLFPKSGASTFLNHRVVMEVNGYVSSHLAAIKPNNNLLDDSFLYYFSLSVDAKNLMQDQNYPSLRLSDIANIDILLPPLSEQRCIVKILDKVFGEMEKAKENAEKNLNNTKELFESYLQSVFANPGGKWGIKKLGEISNVEYGFTDKAKDTGEFRFIRITDIDGYGNLLSTNKMYVEFSKEAKNFLLEENDLLMARTGATFAKVLLYKNIEKSIFASYLIRIRFTEEIINKLYWYFSKSKFYWDQAIKLSSGSAQPQFNGGALKQLIFSYPKSLIEQKSIVKKLDNLAEKTKRLEEIYKQKIANLEELKKSILNKAFRGEL